MVGSTLGKRYEIIEKLGEGGMAVVYRGHDGMLDRTVAIKVLRAQFAADADFVERFRREAQAAASLSHPNVVNIFDVGTDDDDVHFIVMEYVEGRNLKDILRTEGRLPLADALYVTREVCRALAVAHRQHLIHRDIKPHNILVTNDRQVKVTDFGIARAASSATLTQTGTVLGSVHYLSPEQAVGGQVGVASDVYSVGVLLYEMLTGQVPFDGESPVSVALKHLHDPPTPPIKARTDIPPELNELVLQALAKKPEERFATATQMWQALRTVSVAIPGYKEADDTLPGGTVLIAGTASRDGAEDAVAAAGDVGSLTDEITIVHQLPGRDASSRPGPVPTEHGGERALPDNERKRSGGRRFLLWLLLFFGFAAGMVWAGITLFDSLFPPELQVPNVAGMTLEEADGTLRASGLTLRVTHEVFSDRPVNTVIRQSPDAGRAVKAGREIEVQISIGKEVVPVPNLMALSEREALLRLEQSGLKTGTDVERVYRPDVPPNIVVGQDPPAGDRVLRDSPIVLVLSTGAPAVPEVAMPDFVRMSLDAALALAEEMGLVIGDTYAEPDPNFGPGQVVDQMPPAGVSTEVGSVVNFVYTPKSPTTVAETIPGTDNSPPAASGESGTATDPDKPGSASPGGLPSLTPGDTTQQGDALQQALITVIIPPGPAQELEIVVIDSISARRVYQGVHRGDTRTTHIVSGSGPDALYQVWIGGELRDHGFIKEAR